MQVLDNKMTKIGLLVVVALVSLYLVKMNEKKLGKDATLLLMAIVVMGGVYLVLMVNNEDVNESFFVDDATLSDDDDTVSNVSGGAPIMENFEAAAANNAAAEAAAAEVAAAEAAAAVAEPEAQAPAAAAPSGVQNSEQLGSNEDWKNVEGLGANANQVPQECYPKDVLSPQELLPRDTESTWAKSVPAGQGSLSDQNFLNAGFHVGVNTVGQSLRNANRQIRSDPPCPQVKVSPWMQTTIEPDTNRKPMEIGV
jgi:pyruvate/2-oxoglutarate dehydrogenase complex dihydrolipoamide acyltransferase (E2) component